MVEEHVAFSAAIWVDFNGFLLVFKLAFLTKTLTFLVLLLDGLNKDLEFLA